MTPFWILLTLSALVSYGSLRYRNILFSLAASISWLSLMAYNLNYPLVNIAQGSTIHTWMTYIFIILSLSIMLVWFLNRSRGFTGYPRSAKEQTKYDSELRDSNTPPSLMNMSESEYKRTVRRKLRPRGR